MERVLCQSCLETKRNRKRGRGRFTQGGRSTRGGRGGIWSSWDSSQRPVSASTSSTPMVRFKTNNEVETKCFKCSRKGHWRAECWFMDGQSMVNAARSRMKSIGGSPNAAAARVSFQLATEKDSYAYEDAADPYEGNDRYSALVAEYESGSGENASDTERYQDEEEAADENHDFHSAGEQAQMVCLTFQNLLQARKEGWTMLLVRNLGHMFVEWEHTFTNHYSRQQLQTLHQHIMHPSTKKMYDLLARADPQQLHGNTRRTVDDIAKACHAFQTFSNKPMTFQVRFTEMVIFNKQVRLDIMKIDLYAVRHIVDVGINFSAARFIEKKTPTISGKLSYWHGLRCMLAILLRCLRIKDLTSRLINGRIIVNEHLFICIVLAQNRTTCLEKVRRIMLCSGGSKTKCHCLVVQ